MKNLKKLFLPVLAAAFLAAPAQAADTLMMATTTSTQDTGLLEFLAPTFQKETGIELKWVAVGTGKALEIAKNCDADVLLVHAPAAEKEFVKAGHGIDRRQVMYNDFVVVGPKADPAGVKGKDTAAALKTIADKKASFVSRGDQSGTHKAELKLWKQSGLNPDKEAFYISAGQGMMATLNMAAEKSAYTLTDRGTWIKFNARQGAKNPLAIVVEGDKALFNQYSMTQSGNTPGMQRSGENGSHVTNWEVGAQATWNVFEWGTTYYADKQAGWQVTKMRYEQENLKLEVGYDIKSKYLAVQEARKRIAVAQNSVAQATEAYNVALARYHEHVGTNFDVLDASANLTSAQSSLTGAKADYLTALSQIYVAMGEYHPDLLREGGAARRK